MKKTFLKVSALILTLSMLSTMEMLPGITASAKESMQPDIAAIAQLEKINKENLEEGIPASDYNQNEYIVVKKKGISSETFVKQMTNAAPRAKIMKRSLKEDGFAIAKQYKKEKREIAKRNADKTKPGSNKRTSKVPVAAEQPAEVKTKETVLPTVTADGTGENDQEETPEATETDGQAVETPEVKMTAPPSASVKTKDPSLDVKEVFLVEGEKSDIEAIKKMEDVLCVEKNIRVSAYGNNYIPWGVKAVGGEYAHNKDVKGNGVKVAVIDSGILEHPDLRIAGGYNFIDNDDNYTDSQGHGTFVAGIINAQLDGMGVTGIAPAVDMYALKVVDDGLTGALSDVIEAIYWCIENDMDIINMSFGTVADSEALYLAILDAKNAGLLMVGSSGNGTENIVYPARYNEVIAVGAIDNDYKAADFSAAGKELDFVAPGTDIYSTDKENTYASKSGTSYAAAHVAGIAAGILSVDKSKSAAFVETLMQESARHLGEQETYGFGMPDLRQAIDTYDRFEKSFVDEKLDGDWTKPGFAYNKVKAEDDKIRLFDEPIWFEEAMTVKSSPVPLPNNTNKSYTLSKNGASQIKAHFKTIDTEANYDFVKTNSDSSYSGYRTGDTSAAKSGNSIDVTVITDGSVQSNGFEVDKIYYEPNDIPTAPFMVTAKEDPAKTDNVLLSWRASYDSDQISKYEIYQTDKGRQLMGTYTPSNLNDTTAQFSFKPSILNSGYCKFVVVAYDKYGNYSEDSKSVDYDRFDPCVEKIVVQQPMAAGTPKVIAKYENGTYAPSGGDVAIDTKCDVVVHYYDTAFAAVKVNDENIYRNWENYTGQENTLSRTHTVPYTFRAKGINKVKLELINQKGKQISRTLDINVTDTSEAPVVPGISRQGNEEYFYGKEGVYPASGNYCLSNADLELKYPTMNESILRTYNSRKTASGGFGRGWTMSLESKVVQNGSQYRVYYGNGKEDGFYLNGGKYISSNSHDVLETGTVSVGGVSTSYRIVQAGGYTYGYNTSGYLTVIRQKYGNVYKITQDSSNRPVKLTGPSGRYADISYNTDGLITSVTDDTGRASNYYYNNRKQLVTRVSGAGRSTYFTYDTNGFLSSAVSQKETWSPSDDITLKGDTVSYDSSHRAYTLKNGDEQTYTYLYNQSYGGDTGFTRINRYTTIENSGWIDTLSEYYKYNYQLNLIQHVNELEERTYYDVNSYGEITQITDRLGNQSYNDYDAGGNVIKTVNPAGYTRYYRYNSNHDVICESDTDLAAVNAGTLYHNTAWSFYDAKGRLVKTVSTKKDSTEFDSTNNTAAYLDLFTIVTYKYQDEVTNSLPGGYGDMRVEEEVRNSSADKKLTSTSYTAESGDKGCTITTVSPGKETARSVLNRLGYETEVYNADGTVQEMSVDNDGYVQRTISYGKVSPENIKYQVTGITRDFIDLKGDTKQEVIDDEYNASLDGLNFGVSKPAYIKNKNENWAGTRYKTSYNIYGPFYIKLQETLDSYGAAVKTYFNPDGLELKTVSETGVENTLKYDKLGRVIETSEKDESSTRKTNSYSYSKLSRDKVYTGNEISAPNLEMMQETAFNNTGSSINVASTVADFDGRTVQSTNATEGKITDVVNKYDVEGKLTSTVRKTQSGSSVQETVTYFTYDEKGRVIKEESPLAKAGAVTYNSKTETSYYEDDSVKEVRKFDSATGESETYQSTYYEYDSDGRVVLERTGSSGNYNYVQCVLDSKGNVCIQITGLNAKATIKSEITDTNLRDITFNPVSGCSDTEYAMVRKVYDGTTGQLRREVGEDGSVTEYQTYNDFGQPLLVKSPNKNLTDFVYDDQGRCIEKTITAPNGSQTVKKTDYYDIGESINETPNTVYKEISSVKEGTNDAVVTTKIFDNNTRLKEETTGTAKKEYEYDMKGRRTKLKASLNGQTKLNLSYEYGNSNLLQSVKNQNNTVLESYTYYPDGKLQSKVNPVITSNYTYNLQGMISKLTAKKSSSGEIVYEENLERNLNGQINKSTETAGNIIKTYSYDRMGRLNKFTSNTGKTNSYSYDDYHNITVKQANDTASNTNTRTKYTYDKIKLLSRSEEDISTGKSVNANYDGTYTYDDNGNITFDRSALAYYTYNTDNLLKSYVGYGSSLVFNYSYNIDGLLDNVKFRPGTSNDLEYGYVWDEDQLILTAYNDSVTNIVARGNGIIGLINESGSMTSYYVANYHGDVVRVLDAGGNITQACTYDEYGTRLTGSSLLGYGGEYVDSLNGTINLRNRSYSAKMGRFLQKDTYETEENSPVGMNLYSYCDNDPVNAAEPTGRGKPVKDSIPAEDEMVVQDGGGNQLLSNFSKEGIYLAKEKRQILFVHITQPVTIRTTTKRIQGITYPEAKVVMRCEGKYIKTTITSYIGIFTFRKLNLKKYKGKTLQLTASKKGYKSKVGNSKKIK